MYQLSEGLNHVSAEQPSDRQDDELFADRGDKVVVAYHRNGGPVTYQRIDRPGFVPAERQFRCGAMKPVAVQEYEVANAYQRNHDYDRVPAEK